MGHQGDLLLHQSIARWFLLAYLVMSAMLVASAQESAAMGRCGPDETAAPKEAGDGGHEQLQSRNPRYRLHSADVLELTFPFTPEFNQTVTVQPDGYISLRGVDSVPVQGQSLPQLADTLRKAYGKILHEPVVDVELKDFQKPYFIVGGEVGHPGKYDLRGETTTTEAVAIAGGLKDSAKHSEVLLFHRAPDGWVQARKLNMKRMLKHANLDEDAYLRPGDFLYIPQNNMSKFSRFIPTSSLGMYTNPTLH
jgi:protein involved in polysaccharide export with SLBB domain